MRAKKWNAAIIGLVVLAGWGSSASADVAATVDPAGITANLAGGYDLGWRFFVDQQITITHLGIYDHGDDGLTGTHIMGIWRVKKTGGLRLEQWIEVGPGAVTENHHAYVALPEPFTIVPDPEPWYNEQTDPGHTTPYYERWLVGAWSPAGDTDGIWISPVSAATLPIVDAGVIRLQNYTWRYWNGPVNPTLGDVAAITWEPWGQTDTSHHLGVNFKYARPGPSADAGPDAAIYTSEQALTVLDATATHTFPGTAMEYRWCDGSAVLQDWTAVGANGEANLNLAALANPLSIGTYTLTLEVRDLAFTVSDTMTLTVDNTPPEGQPAPTFQVLEIGADAIIIGASVADFDGDTLSYEWVKDNTTIGSGTASPAAGGAPLEILPLTLAAGDPDFVLGSNTVQFVVSDGVNLPVTYEVTVMMQDTMAPRVAPIPSVGMLWPPNQELIPVTIWANGEDNGGGYIDLTASVQCSEDDGGTEPDWYIDAVDSAAGTIALRLRAERSGTGEGRVYTITITATDGVLNQSTATVDIRVPHDRRKK